MNLKIGDKIKLLEPLKFAQVKDYIFEIIFIDQDKQLVLIEVGNGNGHNGNSSGNFLSYYKEKYGVLPDAKYWWIGVSGIKEVINRKQLIFKDLV